MIGILDEHGQETFHKCITFPLSNHEGTWVGEWLDIPLRIATSRLSCFPVTIWVLNPKAFPKFIENQLDVVSQEDMMLAAFHVSRYIRTREAVG